MVCKGISRYNRRRLTQAVSLQKLHKNAMNKKKTTSFNDSCTSFCLDNNGYAIFGANYDHGQIHEGLIFTNKRGVSKSYWEIDLVSEHAQWTSKYGSVTFNLVMNQFAWGGMNEVGLVIGTMELAGGRSPAPDKRPWIYANYWVQYILDNFATVEEVIASRSMIRIKDYVDHYLVCDRAGNCVAVEFLAGEEIYHTGECLPVKVLANNTYEESIDAWERYRSQEPNHRQNINQYPMLLRFVLAAERVSEFVPTDSESAIDYAFDVLDEISGQKVNGSPTHWSIVYDTENLKIAFRTSTHSAVRRISFRGLDFSRSTPIKMLDIHDALSGDITDKMKDYSLSIHREHAMRAGKKWGADRGMIEKEIKFIEGIL
jgi:penicillin V acylase-like amidase (Ntn superfamily)